MLIRATIIWLLLLSFGKAEAAPSDTLVVIFDREHFVRGDSIEIEIYTEPYRSNIPPQTLQLWIDDTETGKRWKYRYPFLKGRCKIILKVGNEIPDGTYAFNFLLQGKFYTINGKLLNATRDDKELNFLVKQKGKVPVIDGVTLQPGAEFRIDHLFFMDSVLFSFSPVVRSKENNLQVTIETPIDSVFIPEATAMEFITIGRTNVAVKDTNRAKAGYTFIKDPTDPKLLKEVVVQTKKKKAVEEYADRYVSGLFANEDASTLDFLESDEWKSFNDLQSYISFKFPFIIQRGTMLYYRNEPLDIYIDEFNGDIDRVPMQDVAMIKFFRQSLRLGGGLNDDGFGGSLAIYTKKPWDKKGNKLSNYTFFLKGYTPLIGVWK